MLLQEDLLVLSLLEKNLDDSVLAGHALARACVQQVGPQYPWPKINIL